MENPVSHPPSPPVRDLELDSAAVGPACRMVLLEADAEGRLIYQIGKRRHTTIPMPRNFAGSTLLVLDSMRAVLVMEPKHKRLEAVYFPWGVSGRTVLLGTNWGRWIDEHGAQKIAISVPELLMQWNVPVNVYEARQTLAFEFHVNIYNREIFTQPTLLSFREGPLRHSLELQFGYPLGGFRLARVKTEDEHTNRVDSFMDLVGFPLIPPDKLGVPRPATPPSAIHAAPAAEKPAAPRPGPVAAPPPPRPGKPAEARPAAATVPPQATGPRVAAPHPHSAGAGTHAAAADHIRKPAGPVGANGPTARYQQAPSAHPNPQHDKESSTARRRKPGPAAPPGPPGATATGPAARPLPRTELLSVNEMLTVIATERDSERRWKMIETNLLMGRPERIYPLIARYPELIGEQAAQWAPTRLKAVFNSQPGAVLIGVMSGWSVNQILAVADGNAESARIIEWLREREIERLLKLDLEREIVSTEQARQALRVDRTADETAIKKTWRTLLGFMNADHGRSEERAIHRKKDEVAKYLQTARNVLLKQH